jgi:hypothetical protein
MALLFGEHSCAAGQSQNSSRSSFAKIDSAMIVIRIYVSAGAPQFAGRILNPE